MQPVVQRFLSYITHDTQSDYYSTTYPSTPSQYAFARLLADECAVIGLQDIQLDEYGYVTATLPANTDTPAPVIAFFAHMDTAPDASGASIHPRIVACYEGGVIPLNEERLLDPDEFPHLKKYIGQDLIVTDGRTLLGADDKAGIAEILTAMEYLIAHPEIKHGTIRVAFTPDEEVGRGVDHFDTDAFGADFGYTVDGEGFGDMEAETFNAARAFFTVTGRSVHPGYAYGTMVNAGLVAAEMIAAFPVNETPASTREHEGFYHLTECKSDVGNATFSFILRDFDRDGLERRKHFVIDLAARFNAKYGSDRVSVRIVDEYRNMKEILDGQPEVVERAMRAVRKIGVEPVLRPVRGGTDGARLSFMGLPCPNLFSGGHNFHGPYEYIPIPSMEAAVRVIAHICAVE